MIKIKRHLLTAILFSTLSATVYGQVEGPCAESLVEANREFEAGHFFQIPGILSGCLKSGFSKEQKIQAYYLLTRTYLFLDRADSAEISYLKLLKEDPEYKVTEENDPIDMVYLSEKFVTTPVFSLKAGGGTNFSHINMVDPFYGTDNSENSAEKYKIRWAYQLYGGVEVHFGNTLSLEANIVTEVNRYYYSNRFYNKEDFTEDLNARYSVKSPVFIKYTFEHDKIRPYIFGGYQPGYLLYAIDKHTSTNNEKQAVVEEEYSSFMSEENINRLGFRAFYDHSVVGGAGVIYKVNYNAVFFEMRYVLGLNTIVTEHFSSDKGRFKETSYYYEWPVGAPTAVTEDDYRLNNLLIQVGYIWPLYKPRKKNEMTLRELFSKSQH